MRNVVLTVVLVLSTLLCACSSDGAMTGLRVMVPNTPGSGYDLVARSMIKVMEDDPSGGAGRPPFSDTKSFTVTG